MTAGKYLRIFLSENPVMKNARQGDLAGAVMRRVERKTDRLDRFSTQPLYTA